MTCQDGVQGAGRDWLKHCYGPSGGIPYAIRPVLHKYNGPAGCQDHQPLYNGTYSKGTGVDGHRAYVIPCCIEPTFQQTGRQWLARRSGTCIIHDMMQKNTPSLTKDSLQAMLDREDRAFVAKVIGRALVALLKRQTVAEQQCNTTDNDNGVGFTGADARSGGITAKYFIKHGTLLDWQVDLWTKKGRSGYSRLTKYWKQLADIADCKARGIQDNKATLTPKSGGPYGVYTPTTPKTPGWN